MTDKEPMGYYCYRCKKNVDSVYTHSKHSKLKPLYSTDDFVNPSKIKKKKGREGLPGLS